VAVAPLVLEGVELTRQETAQVAHDLLDVVGIHQVVDAQLHELGPRVANDIRELLVHAEPVPAGGTSRRSDSRSCASCARI
jgi:hypothetical protein